LALPAKPGRLGEPKAKPNSLLPVGFAALHPTYDLIHEIGDHFGDMDAIEFGGE
jgi:hypothetical protein